MPRVTSQAAEIYYEVHGEGPLLVFAHGMGGNHLSWWQQVPEFTRRGYRVVTFDHRGFGRSTCPAEHFHPLHFPDDLLAILDALGVERAALVCQSMGGWTGLPAGVRAPDRVAALVLCDTPGGLATAKVAEARQRIAEQLGSGPPRGNAALAPDYAEREPQMAFLYDQINALNPGLELTALAKFGDPQAQLQETALAGFAIPTLMLVGERDQLFPPEVLRDVAARIPGAEVVDFPGVGHSTYFEDAARFNQIVADFLARHFPV
jgi:pimeloyl-ACP methyl ester carboxylesterase